MSLNFRANQFGFRPDAEINDELSSSNNLAANSSIPKIQGRKIGQSPLICRIFLTGCKDGMSR
jgi:hypothetical protein